MSRAQLTSTVEQSSGGVVAPFLAGKNKIINGDFAISQRGQSFSNPSFAAYTLDRWRNNNYDVAPTTYSITQVAFDYSSSPASDKLPISGYSGTYFFRSTITTVGSNTVYDTCTQRIEGIPFSNQTVTVSFWAKSDSTRTQKVTLAQNFGSGGSGDAAIFSLSSFTTTSSWQRFTFTGTVANVAGNTIGSNPFLYFSIRQASASGSVLDVWGVQVEAGSVATPFTTASNTLQGELALAQRYYFRQSFVAASQHFGLGQCFSSTQAYAVIPFPVTMRTAPTSVETTGSAGDYILLNSAASGVTCTAVPTFSAGWNNAGQVVATVGSGLTAGNATKLGGLNATSAAYLGWSAEL